MANPIKFTDEELKNLQEIQKTYQQITLAFGQNVVAKMNLDERENSLKNLLSETKEKENTLAKSLTDKYGKGSLDIASGEFTPLKEPTVEESPKQ